MNKPSQYIKEIADAFCSGNYDWSLPDEVWNPVFHHLCENAKDLAKSPVKIHTLWTVNGGHLRKKVGDDNLVLKVLRAYLPTYDGEELTVYRGECRFLYDQNKIGFCWTPEKDVAVRFASGLNAIESGGVLLRALATPVAIITGPNSHSAEQMKEFELTCDPNLLEEMELVASFPKP